MRQRWTLDIKDFGKIKEAKIEISPLMLFVGDNNSGKSYLMSLLWGLLTVGRELFRYNEPSMHSYKKCEQWLQDIIGKDTTIDETVQQYFVDWFNDILQQTKEEFIKTVFNYPVDIGSIVLSQFKRNIPLKIRWAEDAFFIVAMGSKTINETSLRFAYQTGQKPTSKELSRILSYICWKLITDGLSGSGLQIKRKHSGDPIYLPASRTGFMLSYKTLSQIALESEYSLAEEENELRSIFTKPIINFLQDLTKLDIVEN